MSGKNNASTIYRNICPHVTITTLAVEPSADGERVMQKSILTVSPKTKHDRKVFVKGLCP
jgi:hypothetical protein